MKPNEEHGEESVINGKHVNGEKSTAMAVTVFRPWRLRRNGERSSWPTVVAVMVDEDFRIYKIERRWSR
ncbi:hypothetical protein HanIR_Chr15g0757521 [Helianthus annuus]|nr:hypothetical protein HanIR_Chr15g0757521 [Helianthus annuus]